MQSDTLRSLQLGLQFENAKLDLSRLQEDAAFHRREVISALDELRFRLLQHGPAEPVSAPAPLFSQMVPSQPRRSLSQAPATPTSDGSSSPFPSGVSIPDEQEETGGRRMSRLFSMRSKPHRRQSSTSSSVISKMVVAPDLKWLGPEQPKKPPHYELAAEEISRATDEPEQYYGDVKAPVIEPDTDLLHPALVGKDNTIKRNTSTSTHSSSHSQQTQSSAFSDEKIPIVVEDEEWSPFPNASDIAAALPPTGSERSSPHQRITSSSTIGSQFSPSLMSPTGTISSTSPMPSPTIAPDISPHSYWFPNLHTANQPGTAPLAPQAPMPVRDRSNTESTTTSQWTSTARPTSMNSVPNTLNHANSLVGRPSKTNNYWGFCKGSWTVREDWRKGLQMQTIPAGMFGTQAVWQCKHCSFQGGIFGEKKPYNTDPNVHTDAATGIRYKWIFLAKCHTKTKIVAKSGEGGFGCLFCSLQNMPTGVFGSSEVLFKHIMDEHAPGMGDITATRARCIVGRKAVVQEDFDINIPRA